MVYRVFPWGFHGHSRGKTNERHPYEGTSTLTDLLGCQLKTIAPIGKVRLRP